MPGMIDDATKEYFDLKFEALAEKIESGNNAHQKEIAHNAGNIERLREDVSELYDKDRDSKDRIRGLESKFEYHEKQAESNTSGKRFNIEMWVIIGIFLLGTIKDFIRQIPHTP